MIQWSSLHFNQSQKDRDKSCITGIRVLFPAPVSAAASAVGSGGYPSGARAGQRRGRLLLLSGEIRGTNGEILGGISQGEEWGRGAWVRGVEPSSVFKKWQNQRQRDNFIPLAKESIFGRILLSMWTFELVCEMDWYSKASGLTVGQLWQVSSFKKCKASFLIWSWLSKVKCLP